jgi:superfamily II DNA/RNA helicase
MSSQSFADLGVSDAVVAALATRGVSEPFAVQSLVIPDVLAGRDVLVKSPTGSGKTLAFGVPMVDRVADLTRSPSALVLAPTRELAGQIVEQLRDVAAARDRQIAAVYGGAGIERQARQARQAHILVATPGRLEDLLARRAVTLAHVRLLVLDEADRMLDLGFRPAVDRIVAATPRERQTLFFSATLDGDAGRIASGYTRDARRHEHAAPAESRADVEHRFVAVSHERKLDELVGALERYAGERTLVFVRTKRGADRLVTRLRSSRIEAVAMHGNKSQSQRERALALFEAGDVDTLVATDVAARGLHVDDIRHVINFDAPADHEGYVHRTGRTGRAGRTGVATTFVMADQADDVGRIAGGLALHDQFARTGYRPVEVRTPRRDGGRPRRRRGGRRGA